MWPDCDDKIDELWRNSDAMEQELEWYLAEKKQAMIGRPNDIIAELEWYLAEKTKQAMISLQSSNDTWLKETEKVENLSGSCPIILS